jgi:hypothetical protein
MVTTATAAGSSSQSRTPVDRIIVLVAWTAGLSIRFRRFGSLSGSAWSLGFVLQLVTSAEAEARSQGLLRDVDDERLNPAQA